MAERVTSPDGRTWSVRRRWMPRLGRETLWGRFHRRFRQSARRAGDAADVDPGCGVDVAEGIVVFLAIVVLVFLFLFVAAPLVIALVEVIGLLLLSAAALAGRVLFRRPWIIEAETADGDDVQVLQWRVVGWRASVERTREVAALLGSGVTPPDAIAR